MCFCLEQVALDLLKAGAAVDATEEDGWTALMFAAQGGHDSCALELLKAGAAVDATDEDGYTALMFAAQNGHDPCARALLKARADIDHQTPKRVTALNMACENGHEECAVLLLRAGSLSSDVEDAWGDTPRSIAHKKRLQEVLELMSDPSVRA